MKKYIVDLSKPLLAADKKPIPDVTLGQALSNALYTHREEDKTKARRLGEIQDAIATDASKLELGKEDFKDLLAFVESTNQLYMGPKYQILQVLDAAKEEAEKAVQGN